MRFNSLEELIVYIATNNVNVPDVEFNVGTVDDAETGEDEAVNSVTPDVIEEPEVVEEPEEKENIVESVQLNLASGKLSLELVDGVLTVESVSYAKNACGTGSFVLNGVTVCSNMCEMEGHVVAYLNVNDGVVQPIKIRTAN